MAPGPKRRAFDLSEQIVDRLRDLASKYPKGLGLVKEFLQNADDAGASLLRIYFDRRVHHGKLSDPAMEVALGPALLFVNDRQFSEEDLRHIQTISNSAKLRDAGRTGRFGQGFNTSYSVSDHPSLVTGDTIAWFDPHRSIQERNQNAYAWDLREAAQELSAWVATFAPANVDRDGASFDGTVFRLPLRTSQTAVRSKIRKEAFSLSDWEEILTQMRDAGPALLVFLRSILMLEAFEILPSGETRLRVRIRTVNEAQARAARAPLRTVISGQPAALIRKWLESAENLPSAEFDHTFAVEVDGIAPELETWGVVTELTKGHGNVLLREALELCELDDKVLPWVGAAWRREGKSSSGKGGIACFLPLPEADEAPVWLHGWFAIDSARRGIARKAEVDDLLKRRVQWNGLLMEQGVGPAWAKLVMRLRGDANANTQPYELWPRDLDKRHELDQALSAGFYGAVKHLPVFRVHQKAFEWQIIAAEVWDLPESWHERLEAPFRASGIAITVPPLPNYIRRPLEVGGDRLNHLTPEIMRKGLRSLLKHGSLACSLEQAPSPWLSRSTWVQAIAQFCSSDGINQLAGLPLALLSGGRLRCFANDNALYVASEELQELLVPLPHRMLDPEFQRTIFNHRPAESIGVRALNLARMIDVAREVIAHGQLNQDWLRVFFAFLERAPPQEVVAQKEQLKTLPLVPGADRTYSTMGHIGTPLLQLSASPQLLHALSRIGVAFVDGSKELVEAIERFASRHQGFVWSPTPSVVAAVLSIHASRPDIKLAACDDSTVREPLLDLFASVDWAKVDPSVRDTVRALPIFPTLAGHRVAVQEAGVYAPGGLSPPMGIAGSLFLLDLGPGERWRQFVEKLGVGTLDGFRFVKDVLLPVFDGATQEIQNRLLVWLRDDFPRIEASLGREQRQNLRDRIRSTPIIPIRSGGLAPPFRVYAPDASEPEDLLGALARKPDPRRFATERDLWARFFDALELPFLPLARDLYEAVLEKIGKAKEFGVRAVREAILKLATYISNHWGELADCVVGEHVTFGSALRELAWLPARRVGTMDCAAALVPEDRLFRADELAAYRIRHLVASQIPVLDGQDLGKEMAERLGLRTKARFLEVLTHLDRLRQEPLPHSAKIIDAVRTSFLDVMRYVGTEEQEPKAALASWLRSREAEHLILVGRQWLRPARVFLNHLSLSLPGAASVHDDVELARGIGARGVRNGLELFGVREAPSAEDWIAVLNDLVRQHGDKSLPEDALRIARGALRELRGNEPSWLAAQTVSVPTRDGRLVSARNAFLPDDPRLRGEGLASVALVEEIREIIDVAQRAGSHSLRGSLRDQLHEETIEFVTADHRRWCSTYERRIRSKVFHDALLRVEYEEALREGNAGPCAASHAEHLGKVRSLRIRIAERLRVQSLLMPDCALVVFDYEASKFLDEGAETLWLNAAAARRMFDEVVRTVCKMCGVGDMLIVSRLLDVEPEQMHSVLNDDGIAVVPVGRELMATDLASHDGAKEGDELYGEGGELDWFEHKGSNSHHDGDENQHPDVYSNTPRAWAGNVLGFSGDSGGGARSGPSDAAGSSSAVLLGADLFLDPEAPRPLSHGSSSPWNSNDVRAFPRLGSSGIRRGTYAYPVPQADYDTGDADGNMQLGLELHRAAVALVGAYETKRGNFTSQVDGELEGYDLVSGEGAEQRFVKIRGIDGPWTARGVGLTRREIDTSLREGSRWWLYVVEYALDPLRASVLPLQNPLGQADELRLDNGWRVKSEVTRDLVKGGGAPVVGEVVKHGNGRMATVLEVECFDSVCEVLLKFSDEEVLSCVWQSSWRQAK